MGGIEGAIDGIMSYKLIIRAEAEAEIENAYHWYEARQSGLGRDFLLRVDACLSLIRKNPHSYPVKYKQVRQALLQRFPYSVLYLAAEDAVSVIAVFHSKRDPAIWQGRA
jgi:plasmid stabilization system protein ParE